MEPVQFKCQCQAAASHWIGMSPTHPHRYKVQCGSCEKFIKWGKEQELHYRVKARDKITVSSYDPDEQIPRATLERFIE